MANELTNQKIGGQENLGGLNCVVERNHYGRQLSSFQADLKVEVSHGDEKSLISPTTPHPHSPTTTAHPHTHTHSNQPTTTTQELGEEPFNAIFIRAPGIKTVGDGVEVLARIKYVKDDKEEVTPVAVRQGGCRVVLCSAGICESCDVPIPPGPTLMRATSLRFTARDYIPP